MSKHGEPFLKGVSRAGEVTGIFPVKPVVNVTFLLGGVD